MDLLKLNSLWFKTSFYKPTFVENRGNKNTNRVNNFNPIRKEWNYFFAGVIITCARCVPGSISHGIPGAEGLSENPVDSVVAYGI